MPIIGTRVMTVINYVFRFIDKHNRQQIFVDYRVFVFALAKDSHDVGRSRLVLFILLLFRKVSKTKVSFAGSYLKPQYVSD
jgi:hypothetical protein